MSKAKSQVYLLGENAEKEQAFLTNPAAVDPFVSLSVYVIQTGELITQFREAVRKGEGLEAERTGLMIREIMERVKDEACNVQVDVACRNIQGGV